MELKQLGKTRFTSDIHKSREYSAKTPEPNYSQFKAQLKKKNVYIDLMGREYILASGDMRDKYVTQGFITSPDYKEPNPSSIESVGTLLFWIRIPIKLRNRVPFPDPEGEKLTLYYPKEQILCRAITDGVFYSGPKKKTGYVVMRNFKTFGQVIDPDRYESVIFHRFIKKDHLF